MTADRYWTAEDVLALPDSDVRYETIGVRANGELAIPDIVALAADAPRGVSAHQPFDVLLVVEIVSKGSTGEDRVTKPELYAAAGIPWYWRVEPNNYRSRTLPLPVIIHVHGMTEFGEYTEQHAVGAGGLLAVNQPFPISLDPATLVF